MVLFCSWIFAVQVVPYIIEEEIMEHMGQRKTFSTIIFAVQVVPYIIEEEIMEHMGERKTFTTTLQLRNR